MGVLGRGQFWKNTQRGPNEREYFWAPLPGILKGNEKSLRSWGFEIADRKMTEKVYSRENYLSSG